MRTTVTFKKLTTLRKGILILLGTKSGSNEGKNMFELATIEDTVWVEPELIGSKKEESVKNSLAKKYENRFSRTKALYLR